MSSYDYGKAEVCAWIREHIPTDNTVLDVGTCDGKWRHLLPDYQNMDGCEIFLPSAEAVRDQYRFMFAGDIYDYHYDYYDLIIFGDVIEHMTVELAQSVLNYAALHAGVIIVGVPFLYQQGPMYGNQYEEHLQPDLTPELFDQRYKGFSELIRPTHDYCYYLSSPGARK